jgi:drug/metabolite transporter (DMT)-like permease
MNLNKLPNKILLAHLALIAVSLIWGAATPIIKYTLAYIPPLTFIFLRFLVVGVVLLPLVISELRKIKVNKSDYLNFILLGIFSQSSLLILFLALNYTSAIDSALIGIMGSVLTVIAGHYFYSEKVNQKKTLGFILAIVGTFVVMIEPALIGSEDMAGVDVKKRLFGNLLAILYNFSWTMYVIWSKMSMGQNSKILKKTLHFIHIKPMSKNYSSNLIVYISFYVGLATTIPFALMEYFGNLGTSNFTLASIDYRGWLGIMYMAILSSIVAYLLNQWAMQIIKVADIAIYSHASIFFTIPVAFFLVSEIPSPIAILGGIITAIGVVVAEYKNN